MQTVLLVSLLGLVGVLSRYGVDQFLGNWNEQFPVTTLAVNILGSLIAGTIYVLSINRDFPVGFQTALLIGFCGGFTTFSAYTLQTLIMFERGRFAPALVYFLLSPALGLLATFVPILIVRKLLV